VRSGGNETIQSEGGNRGGRKKVPIKNFPKNGWNGEKKGYYGLKTKKGLPEDLRNSRLRGPTIAVPKSEIRSFWGRTKEKRIP